MERKIIIWAVVAMSLLMLLNTMAGLSSAQEKKVTEKGIIWIYNVYDLQNMSKDLNASYALANDIDATITKTWNNGAGFVPIGDNNNPFNGTFDGNGHKIINLWINRSSQDYVGLFGYTTSNAVIENVGLVNVSVRGNNYTGGLIGLNDGTVSNSYATGNVSGSYNVGGLVGGNAGTVSNSYFTGNVSGINEVGGLVGWNGYYGTVKNSHSTGSVIGDDRVGGLVGYNDYGTVNNSYATGSVSVSGNYCKDTGGLVGYNDGTVKNSYSTGNVNGYGDVGGLVGMMDHGIVSNSYATGNVSGNEGVGGLVGWNADPCTVSNSYATGNVSGINDDVGGLIGLNDGTVSNSYATGNVSGSNYVGGLIGENGDESTVSNSYSTGSVSGSYNVGGLVGYNYGTVNNSYSTGIVSGSYNVGGLVGENWGTITASFWDVDTSGQTTSDGGTGLTTEEMKNKTTFLNAGWDFTNIWGIVDGQTYPYLLWSIMPRELKVEAGVGFVNLTWKAPANKDGAQITDYNIYRDGAKIATVPSDQLWYNDTNVTNGQTYTYYVTAVNVAGESPKSNEVQATPGSTIPEISIWLIGILAIALLFAKRRR